MCAAALENNDESYSLCVACLFCYLTKTLKPTINRVDVWKETEVDGIWIGIVRMVNVLKKFVVSQEKHLV